MRQIVRRGVVACVLWPAIAAAEQADTPSLPVVEVIAPTPVPGIGIPRDRLPSNIQILRSSDLDDEEPIIGLPEAMGLKLPSVSSNEIQGNPYQPDVNFRGFTASPLLGTPQGLSIFQDGVRINEPFGDIVNWDLVPQAAIDSVVLVPGSNPLFGLNTLGGALTIRTKSGDTHPGGEIELSGGSFKRRTGEFSFGRGLGADMHLFVAGTWFKEDGWRDFSPSDVKQGFAKLGQRTSHYEWDLALTAGDTDLVGNGLVPQSFFDQRREAIFTRPDNTRNRLGMLTFNGAYVLSAAQRLSATLYARRVKTRTLNGDVNDAFEDGPNDLAAGGTGLNVGTAVNNRTATEQTGYGGALQWTLVAAGHHVAVGITHDRSQTDFAQNAQLGVFDDTRAVVETDPSELENALEGRTLASAVFAHDTWSLRDNLHLTLAGRFNASRITLHDTGPSAPALDGEHRFSKLNPAAGVSYQATSALTLYAGFDQGNRAPTPIELGCADPDRPCTLPNALAADPPLNQVIARTFELGARGRLFGDIRWNAGAFQTTNTDDILFVGTTTSAGYFTNFGKTRRQGVELGLSGRAAGLQWHAAYSYIRATFESAACIVSPSNSSRGTSMECSPEDPANPGTFLGDDLIAVRPGDRIPGIPAHNFKLALGYVATESWRLGADLLAFSDQFVRGNENNQHQAGTFQDRNGETRTFLGPGRVPEYALVNLHTRYRLGKGWELFGRINNVFDRRYFTAGALAENPFDAGGVFQTNSAVWSHETFVAPGAPRGIWLGIRYGIGKT